MENCFQANLRFINLGDTFQKALSVGASVRKAGETPNLLVKTRSPGDFLCHTSCAKEQASLNFMAAISV